MPPPKEQIERLDDVPSYASQVVSRCYSLTHTSLTHSLIYNCAVCTRDLFMVSKDTPSAAQPLALAETALGVAWVKEPRNHATNCCHPSNRVG